MLALLKGFLTGEDVRHPKQDPLCSGAPPELCPVQGASRPSVRPEAVREAELFFSH